jgi:aspartate aminotransferase
VTLPGSAFGESPGALQLRMATGLLYGDTTSRQEEALAAADPLALPWIADQLARLQEILEDLAP